MSSSPANYPNPQVEDQQNYWDRKRCSAHTALGVQCRQRADYGSNVCIYHGGNLPQVKRAGQARFLALVEPALDALEKCIEKADWPYVLKAAEMIFNRAGFPNKSVTEVQKAATSEVDLTNLSEEDLMIRAEALARRLVEAKRAKESVNADPPTRRVLGPPALPEVTDAVIDPIHLDHPEPKRPIRHDTASQIVEADIP